ncbi:MAG: DUF2235 domain-containing protein [Sulfuricurvum sp.]|jgi:hypothetical protein
MAEVIRIGACFDGTGNNMWNDLAIGDKSETNVAKIYKMYKDAGYIALYVEGVGTEDYRGKTLTPEQIKEVRTASSRNNYYNTVNMAFGGAAKDKVVWMLAQVTNKIAEVKQAHPDATIIVDVYGFSRGATESRDFVNEFNARYADVERGSVIGFVGLFDTVSSIGFASSVHIGFNLNISDHSATKIVQIDAADEMRANFPLESLGNGTNRVEVSMIGAHADIGGGYGNSLGDSEELLILDVVSESFIPMAIAEMAINKRADRIAQLNAQAKDQATKTGKAIEFKYDERITYARNGNLELHGVLIETRHVGFGLSNNALHKLYEYMAAQGISLTLSDYPMVPNHHDYVHTSSMNRLYNRRGLADWIANRDEWSPVDGKRDTHANYPEGAMTKLLLLSPEDKTILSMNNTPYTIIGTPAQFAKYESSIKAKGADFSTKRLAEIVQLLT